MNDQLVGRLRERIKAAGFNQLSVTKAAGIGPDTVRMILAGRTKSPGADKLAALARVLGTSTPYLLGQTDDPGPEAPTLKKEQPPPGPTWEKVAKLQAQIIELQNRLMGYDR